jgi:hypothetical protein
MRRLVGLLLLGVVGGCMSDDRYNGYYGQPPVYYPPVVPQASGCAPPPSTCGASYGIQQSGFQQTGIQQTGFTPPPPPYQTTEPPR